jgi:MFS family permease
MNRWLSPVPELSQQDVDRSMRLVLLDGLTTQIMCTLTGGVFVTAYALHIGASNLIVGLLAAIPFLAQLVQLPAVLLVERVRNRRLLVVSHAAAGRAALLLAAAGCLLPNRWSLTLLLLGLALQASVGAVSACAWFSWMRDVIPPERLGGFFSKRLFWMTLLSASLSYAGGHALDGWIAIHPDQQKLAHGVLFALGAAVGAVGVWLLSRTMEPAMPPPTANASFRDVLAQPFSDPNFRRLLLFIGPWSFAVNLASPFFTVYMLNRLHMGMAEVMPLVIFSQLTNLISLGLWGRLTDRFSNKTVLTLCGPLYILCFVGWIFTTFPDVHAGTVPLLYVLHGVMGIATAGVTLATGNIALKLSPKDRATAYLALNGMVSALAAGTAPILGGLCADWFDQRDLTVSIHWSGPDSALAFDTISLQAWDFFFLMASVLGLFSLHRLSLVREVGEIANRALLRQAFIATRRGLYTISSVAGLRQLAGIPSAELLKEHEATDPETVFQDTLPANAIAEERSAA